MYIKMDSYMNILINQFFAKTFQCLKKTWKQMKTKIIKEKSYFPQVKVSFWFFFVTKRKTIKRKRTKTKGKSSPWKCKSYWTSFKMHLESDFLLASAKWWWIIQKYIQLFCSTIGCCCCAIGNGMAIFCLFVEMRKSIFISFYSVSHINFIHNILNNGSDKERN